MRVRAKLCQSGPHFRMPDVKDVLSIPISTDWFHHCLLSTNKMVCGEHSGVVWLPSHHPGGCCTLVVDQEIPLTV